MLGRRHRRRRHAWLTGALAVLLAMVSSAIPAYAEPGTDDEGAPRTLREKLEAASVAYYDVKNALTASKKREAVITKRLREAEITLTRLGADVGTIAAARYKGGHVGTMSSILLEQGSTATMLQGIAVAEYLLWREDERLRLYREAREESVKQKTLLNAEIAFQTRQLAELDRQKRAAEKALAAVGGMVTSGYTGDVPEAQPAPRNRDGSWPRESCSINDPTSGGCLTPRMYHALNEARLAGFTRYVHCWRQQAWGEHPKGRACDFSVYTSGFGGAATGLNRTYGNRLAAWCKENAEALGVLYVIWYRQIWMPGVGWRAYSGYGDASSEHTNHVHLSML